MRQAATDSVVVHQRLHVGIVERSLHVLAANVAAQSLGKLCVDCMAGLVAITRPLSGRPIRARSPIRSMSLWRAGSLGAVRGRSLIKPNTLASWCGTPIRSARWSSSAWSLGGLVYHYGVVEVTALDEAGLEQRLDVANEHERAGLRHFGTEVGYAVESGILVGQEPDSKFTFTSRLKSSSGRSMSFERWKGSTTSTCASRNRSLCRQPARRDPHCLSPRRTDGRAAVEDKAFRGRRL